MKSENQCEECDDHLKILLMFQRTADSLGQADQDEAWEVLENPIEEIIAGYITDVVKEYFNVFICIIDFFNLLHGVNKNRRKLFEEIIDDEVGRVQITVVKSPWVEIANTLKKSADSDEEDSTALWVEKTRGWSLTSLFYILARVDRWWRGSELVKTEFVQEVPAEI